MKTTCLVYLILASCLLAGVAAQSNETSVGSNMGELPYETTGSLSIRELYIVEGGTGVGHPLPIRIIISNDGPMDFNGPFWANLFADDLLIEENGAAALFLASGESMEFNFARPVTFMEAGPHTVSVQIGSGEQVFNEKSATVFVSDELMEPPSFSVSEFYIEPMDLMVDKSFSGGFTIENYLDKELSLDCGLFVKVHLATDTGRVLDSGNEDRPLVTETFKIPPGPAKKYKFAKISGIKYPGTYLLNLSCKDQFGVSSQSLELHVGGEASQDKPESTGAPMASSASPFDSTTGLGGKTAGGMVPPANSEGAKSILLLLVLGVLAAIAFGVIYYVEKKRRKVKTKEISEDLEEAIELEQLKKKKDEIEEMIKIAKAKYYKRAMDEDVYKKIVGDNQNKLIEIEAKINEIERRVERLEGSIKKATK